MVVQESAVPETAPLLGHDLVAAKAGPRTAGHGIAAVAILLMVAVGFMVGTARMENGAGGSAQGEALALHFAHGR